MAFFQSLKNSKKLYFTNHQHQMKYAEHAVANFPIGSGVSEGACN